MFHLLAESDLSVARLSRRTIFLIGLTRVGKSTLFNYILKNKLLGVRDSNMAVGY